MTTETTEMPILRSPASWGAVFSMALCVATLIASEFMPVSLLTPIASDLGVTEGQTGQAISISGIFAVLTSLFVAQLTRNIDRRLVVLAFSALLIVSGSLVAFAPNYLWLMVGRSLLGLAIGGFWGMSTSIIMRLVPTEDVPRGLAMLNAGNAIAATISAPLGSYLGDIIGWRGAFFFVVPLAVMAFVWQWIALPSLPSRRTAGQGNVFRLLKRPQVALGMASITLLFMGQFGLFTYLRPYLETVTGVSIPVLSTILLVMGLAGVAGTWAITQALRTRLFSVVILIPLVMAAIAVALIGFATIPFAVGTLLLLWGFFGTAAPVGWGAWLATTLPEDAEAGGGLQVALIQFAITVGAAGGGLLFDQAGWWAPFVFGAIILCGSSALAYAAFRNSQGVNS
jgi:predicted MFS family arabinose efflux permease